MRRPPSTRPTPELFRQITCGVAGALLLVLGLGCLALSVHDVQLLAFEGEYIDAELEIVKYHYFEDPGKTVRRGNRVRREGSSGRRNPIDGVIHPGGIPVHTNDRDISLAVLDTSDAVVVERPLREEVEGKRLPVLYWTGDPAARGWYHPPLVTTAPRPSPVRTGVSAVLCGGLLFAAVASFRGTRPRRPFVGGPPRKWPAWTLLAVLGCGITWPLLAVMAVALTRGHRVNRTGTDRIPWTNHEWTMSGLALGIVAVVPVLCAALLVVAVRKRATYRR